MTAHLTTHILDATSGTPAVGVEVGLAALGGGEIARGMTDDDGRLALGPPTLPAGDYSITFRTGAWFAAQGRVGFYPVVAISFTVDDGAGHYHVPLLLSPFAYSTYRGS